MCNDNVDKKETTIRNQYKLIRNNIQQATLLIYLQHRDSRLEKKKQCTLISVRHSNASFHNNLAEYSQGIWDEWQYN